MFLASRPRAFNLLSLALLLFVPGPLSAQIVINEFMAGNRDGLKDEDGDRSDWIELHNTGTTNVDLQGWFLTDTTNQPTKWKFPPVSLPANGYLVVFASQKDRAIAGRELHTNFRLNLAGEYLALIEPDGQTVAFEYAPRFPQQFEDVAYGLGRDSEEIVLLETGAAARAVIPMDAAMGDFWNDVDFDDGSWLSGTTGIGYDYAGLVGLDVGEMRNVNQTVYVRIPFVVTNVAQLDTLTMPLQYQDGMIAYLNGQEVARDNAPDTATYNSGAPANRPDDTAINFSDFDLTSFLGFLQVGTNVLAFQGLNNGLTSSDILIRPRLVGTTRPTGVALRRYFPLSTPGEANNAGVASLGPIITETQHSPNVPVPGQDVQVTARITPAFAPVASAMLHYRIMFSNEVTVPFLDDGLHGDGIAGDQVYGATVPNAGAQAGQMIRWYITATDSHGQPSRFPDFLDPLDSSEYLGTMVDVAIASSVPVYHLFLENPAAADTDSGGRGAIFYNGEFYDNVLFNLHGQSSRGFPKKSHNVYLPKGHKFRYEEGAKRVSKFNLLTTYPDKAHMRNMLAYETYENAGAPYHVAFDVRLQQNGSFLSDAHFVEKGDDDFLQRIGRDPNGALYKMYNTLSTATSDAEKKTRRDEDHSDLAALIDGARLTGPARDQYFFDNMDIPEVVNYFAATIITGNVDCCHKNYYVYRDTEGNGEWQIFPWDVDLSFGRVWISSLTYWDDTMNTDTGLFVGNNNVVMGALYNTPVVREMYLRRVRTLMDELLQPPGTPAQDLKFERRIDELAGEIGPTAALDFDAWPTWGRGSATSTCCIQTMTQAVDILKEQYLPVRRAYLYNQTQIPAAQPADAAVHFGMFDYSPASGNQAEEYFTLRNTNNYAVDISNWRVTGGINFTLKPGTVIPATGTLYISPDVVAFRARGGMPGGGQALFVQGDYKGQLSTRPATFHLWNAEGVEVSRASYAGNPSAAQDALRVTELMYHPAPPAAGSPYTSEDFEYLALQNIENSALDLTGVHFAKGIDFDFTGSAVTNLAPAARVIVVKNAAAFISRYGPVDGIAGEFTGNLDNAGETLRLVDAANEIILEFTYDNRWLPVTDGPGFSLVIRDALASWDTWTLADSWRTSHQDGGEVLGGMPPATGGAPVLINEILTSSQLPDVDAIELFNPTTTNADIGGWYLTDNFAAAKKFRIPDGTILPAGGYLTFDENDFNTNSPAPGSFALSAAGEEVYLFSGDAAGNLTGYYQGWKFGPAESGVSFGRYIGSDGEEHFVAQSAVTLGESNAPPKVGPLVISELINHPPAAVVPASGLPASLEFIELHNTTSNAVDLFDPAIPTNTWHLDGAVTFAFPPATTVEPGSYLLVVGFNPSADLAAAAQFNARYAMPAGTLLFGPFAGQLNNAGESVALFKPGAPLPPGDPNEGLVPSILVDQLAYNDAPPWPLAADGMGPSLQRTDLSVFGNEADRWVAAAPSAGRPYAGGTPPRIITQPASQTVIARTDAMLSVTPQGAGPFGFQWRFNGANIPNATNAVLSLPNIQPSQAGDYIVVVLNPANAINSDVAHVTVLTPATVTGQPADQAVPPGRDVTFAATAIGTGQLQYQWEVDGMLIPGATTPSLTLTNVQLADSGNYRVHVTDDIGEDYSLPANLRVEVAPMISEQPISQEVPEGGTAVFTTAAVGTVPMGFRWRHAGITVAHEFSGLLIITNAQASDAGNYDVIVTNGVTIGVRSDTFTLTILPDTDHDGLPDTYEMSHGLSLNDPADAGRDDDGDGMTNGDEFRAGTDPMDGSNYLKVDGHIDAASGGAALEFMAVSNQTYSVVFTDQLGGNNWSRLFDVNARTTNRVIRVTDPNSNQAARFYRLVTPRMAE